MLEPDTTCHPAADWGVCGICCGGRQGRWLRDCSDRRAGSDWPGPDEPGPAASLQAQSLGRLCDQGQSQQGQQRHKVEDTERVAARRRPPRDRRHTSLTTTPSKAMVTATAQPKHSQPVHRSSKVWGLENRRDIEVRKFQASRGLARLPALFSSRDCSHILRSKLLRERDGLACNRSLAQASAGEASKRAVPAAVYRVPGNMNHPEIYDKFVVPEGVDKCAAASLLARRSPVCGRCTQRVAAPSHQMQSAR